jgi:hypothetical protein
MDTDLLSREVSNKIFFLHVVKCVLQLLGGYVNTNFSNSLTKFFDSVMFYYFRGFDFFLDILVLFAFHVL